MTSPFSAPAALGYLEAQGIVLATARGPLPRLIEVIAGEAIAGNWWVHAQARRIYNVLAAVSESEQVLVCRLVEGRITLVHARLWPALARIADRFAPERIARVREQHTASGRHVSHDVAFADWLPAEMRQRAQAMTESEALALLGRFVEPAKRAGKGPDRAPGTRHTARP